MEGALNAVGVPAARVRTLAEFLGEAPGRVTHPVSALPEGEKLPGLGFTFAQDGPAVLRGAPALGADNEVMTTKHVVGAR